MTSACSARLMRELQLLQKSPSEGIHASMTNEQLHTIHAQILGPPSSPYASGIFNLELQIPHRYPFDPPRLRFVTPIYHPNIDSGGRICLDSLAMPPKGCWTPALSLPALLTTVRALLSSPNARDGLMREAAQLYVSDKRAFEAKAREWTRRYAMPNAAEAKALRPSNLNLNNGTQLMNNTKSSPSHLNSKALKRKFVETLSRSPLNENKKPRTNVGRSVEVMAD